MDIAPLDVLIVDEAAQVWECELVIPLRLHSMKHVVLVGDDCQLSAMVKSQVRFSLDLLILYIFIP
jgi:superfamily I DNA and/or RNA helicase